MLSPEMEDSDQPGVATLLAAVDGPAGRSGDDRIGTIMVVEDNSAYALLVREMLSESLESVSDVEHCASVASAENRLRSGADVDCVLLDLSLPDARGLEGLQRIKAAATSVPIVILTGSDDESRGVEAVSEGAQDYLLKRDVEGRLLGRAVRYAVERKRAELELAYRALHDGLTGLANRTLFADRLELALARGSRHATSVAVLFLDLDRFKVVNDSLGHEVGDGLLVGVADRLRELVRPSDTVARFGGDEFLVLCEDLRDERDAVAVAERVLAGMTEPFYIEDQEIFSALSVGIALSGAGASPEALIRGADRAMYGAKRTGTRLEIFDPATHVDAVRALTLENELRHALERREFALHYQPLFDLGSGRAIAVEALLRWRHPERGLLLPAEFIPIAESTGMIVPLGRWVIAEACRQLAHWKTDGKHAKLRMSINLSPRQLGDAGLVEAVRSAVVETGLEPSDLCLEITEGTLAREPQRAAATMGALKALGVHIAVDDFGAGYSWFGGLDRYPLDCFKIDRSLIASIGHRPAWREALTAILALARAVAPHVVVEGVEESSQAELLAELGCEAAQGFYFARPDEPDVIAGHLSEGLRS